MSFSETLVALPYALSMSFSVTPVGLRPQGSMRCPVTLYVLQPLVALVGHRPPGCWTRTGPLGTVIIAFIVLDGGSAGAQLSFGRHGELGAMGWLEAQVSFPPTPLGSLGRSEGCLFGSAFLPLVGGSAGAHFFFV